MKAIQFIFNQQTDTKTTFSFINIVQVHVTIMMAGLLLAAAFPDGLFNKEFNK